ncbi:MAG: DUF1385 domain-containing protein [bacterium]|jgi:uncharacterized protein YqhQ
MRIKPKEILVGGQAVWEGVMMRSPQGIALAVRQSTGDIQVQKISYSPLSKRYPLFRWPFFRGMGALWEALILGVRALNISLSLANKEEDRLTPAQMALSFALAIGMVVGVFFLLPLFISRLLIPVLTSQWVLIVEGCLRFLFFFLYLALIRLIPEVRRILLQYHGAEHKAVHAFEHGEPLTVEAASKYTTLHPRCSTSFLLVVLIVSFVLFAFLDFSQWYWRLLSRILLLPFIAGFSFELIRLVVFYPRNWISKAIVLPGLLTQKLTTAEPTPEQIEVALRALQSSLEPCDV